MNTHIKRRGDISEYINTKHIYIYRYRFQKDQVVEHYYMSPLLAPDHLTAGMSPLLAPDHLTAGMQTYYLYSVILYYIIFCYIILYYITLYYIILYCIILYVYIYIIHITCVYTHRILLQLLAFPFQKTCCHSDITASLFGNVCLALTTSS